MKQSITIFFLLFLFLFLGSCSKSSSEKKASYARTRYKIKEGGRLKVDEIKIEEYLAHASFDYPSSNEDLGVYASWQKINNEEMHFQLCLKGKRDSDKLIPPMNIALVLDVSGSMQENNKINYLKEAVKQFVDGLRSKDKIALIKYSTNAEVISSMNSRKTKLQLQQTIDSLSPLGSTNLSEGMLLGLKEVKRNYNKDKVNKIIVLTDGIANNGITDPEQIYSAVLPYVNKGINITTIALGDDIDDKLMRNIAEVGKGAYYFIDSGEEIKKVFVKELKQWLGNAVADIKARITFHDDLKLTSIYGQKIQKKSNHEIVLDIPAIGNNEEFVIYAKAVINASVAPDKIGTIKLSYKTDNKLNKIQQPLDLQLLSQSVKTAYSHDNGINDVRLLKGYALVLYGESLLQLTKLQNQNRGQAGQIAKSVKSELSKIQHNLNDKKINEIYDLYSKYTETLRSSADTVVANNNPRPQKYSYQQKDEGLLDGIGVYFWIFILTTGGIIVWRVKANNSNKFKITKQDYEKMLIKSAFEHDGRITASEAVVVTGLAMDQAKKILQDMAQKGDIASELTSEGIIVYHFHEINVLSKEKVTPDSK